MSRGHGGSRRRNYGPRQRDLRDRLGSDLVIDLDGPTTWPRGGAWDVPANAVVAHADRQPQRPGGPA